MPEHYDLEELSSVMRSAINDDSSSILILEEAGQILGPAEICIKDGESSSAVVGRRNGYLQSIVVSEGQRRLGWGRVLVDETEKWAQQRGTEEMRLDIWEFDEGPLRFYEKSGYGTLRREMIRRFEQ